MPRKNTRLPYVKVRGDGSLSYLRQIPPRLRPYLGNRASIRRNFPTDCRDITDSRTIAVYAQLHAAISAEIERAEAAASRGSALIENNSQHALANQEQFPLRTLDIAGIAGQVWKSIRDAVANQQGVPKELFEAATALAIKAKSQGISAVSLADFGSLAVPTLKELQIKPSPADMQRIGEAIMQYFPIMQDDMEKLAALDFSPPKLETVAPPLPKRQVTWRNLFEAWLVSTGGILEREGYGVSQERQLPYQKGITEFKQVIGDINPSEVTPAIALKYLAWLETESAVAIRTRQGKLGCLRNLFRIGKARQLISSNPFEGLQISAPSGVIDANSYRPLTKEELIKVFTVITKEERIQYSLLFYILLCTGCRVGEALQLRTFDLKQTDKGIWFFDWKHEPLHQYPMMLKTKTNNNRRTPVHPGLLEEGLLEVDRSHDGRFFKDANPKTESYSLYFKKVLQKLDIWEKKKTVAHSLRGSARDLWRLSGMPQDYRNAMTGHVTKEVGERHYGLGLQQMPDEVYKHLKNVDLSWLP